MNNIREDFNEMVTGIGLGLEKGRFNDKSICSVKFYNGQVAKFLDKDRKLYDVLKVYKDMGFELKNVIKSRKLVEREKKSDFEIDNDIFDENSGTFIAVSYILEDDREYLMFPERQCDFKLVSLSYDKFKQEQKAQKIQKGDK